MNLFCCLFPVLFTLEFVLTDPIIDVDVSTTTTQYTYTADTDSKQLVYRCINGGTSDGLVWRYNNVDYTNTLNAYQFYKVVRRIGVYSIDCYSGISNVGSMILTLRDSANMTTEYSGQREIYSSSPSGVDYYTVTIPIDTTDINITCEISRGFIYSQSTGFSSTTTNPSVTFTLTNSSGSGRYSCLRDIDGVYFTVLILNIVTGEAVTTTLTTTSTTPTIITTPTITISTTEATTISSMTTPTSVPTSTPTQTITPTQTTTPTTTPTQTITTTPTQTTTPTTTPTPTTTTTITTAPAPTTILPTTTTLYTVYLVTSQPQTTPTTTNTTTSPTQQPAADNSGIIIGILLLITIIVITAVATGLVTLCLWRHYSGFKRSKYSKQGEEGDNRNGSMLREIVTSPRQFHSVAGPYYEQLPTSYLEDPSQSVVLEEFMGQLDLLWGNDCALLTSEYTSLGQSELRYPTEAAREHITDGKNRYKNIYPYDSSRVHLVQKVNGSDYVNASYIPGLLIPELFIAAQAPKKETMLEFWEMLWQKRVSNVVMLTKVMEGNKKKCEAYLPERTGETIGVGDILVTLLKVQSEHDQTVRLLEVKNRCDIMTMFRMKHFHFSGWPDHEAPRFPKGLLDFIIKVKTDKISDNSPICTHCSAGVGRTGAFIALYNLMEEIKKQDSFSVLSVVNDMREHRPHMVQTFTQYKFIYLSCLELIQGDTVIPCNTYCYIYKTQLEPRPSVLQSQLSDIDYFSEKAFSRSSSEALSSKNATLNPELTVWPYDDYRPALSTAAWGVGGYINASYVDGYQGYQDMIATQHPNVFTARHTVQLIFQTECPLVVVLTSPEEYEGMGYEQGRIVYWPEPATQHEFEGFVLKNVSQQQEEIMEFVLIDTSENIQHRFHLIVSLHWDVSGAVTDNRSVLGIVHEMISAKANFPRNPIIIHCEDGASKTGVLIAIYNSITQLTEEKRVDVSQIVKCMRYCRPRMVNSIIQYNSIHSVIHHHLAPNTYENLSTIRQ